MAVKVLAKVSQIQVTVQTSNREELRDLLDSPAWDFVVTLVASDVLPLRKSLLTSLSLSETQRVSYVSSLSTYKRLFDSIYQSAGFKHMPTKYLELFTGSETN